MVELEKCKNSMVYFYNNYLRKVGEPEVEEDYFEGLKELKKIKDTTRLISPRKWSKSYYYGK